MPCCPPPPARVYQKLQFKVPKGPSHGATKNGCGDGGLVEMLVQKMSPSWLVLLLCTPGHGQVLSFPTRPSPSRDLSVPFSFSTGSCLSRLPAHKSYFSACFGMSTAWHKLSRVGDSASLLKKRFQLWGPEKLATACGHCSPQWGVLRTSQRRQTDPRRTSSGVSESCVLGIWPTL